MHFFHKLAISENLVSQKLMQRHFFFTLHPFSPVIFATSTVMATVLLRYSRFNFHCCTQRKAMPTQKSAWKWCYDLSRLLARKITKGIHLCKPASLNHPMHVFFLGYVKVLFCIAWKQINQLYSALAELTHVQLADKKAQWWQSLWAKGNKTFEQLKIM